MEFGMTMSFLLVAVFGPMGLTACNMELMQQCQEKAAPMMTGPQPDSSSTKADIMEYCNKFNQAQGCMTEILESCASQLPPQMSGVGDLLNMAKSMCDSSSPCSMLKLMDCVEGLPRSEEEAKTADMKKICSVLPKRRTCLERMQADCPNNPMISMPVSQLLQSAPMMDTQCKQNYGDDYATTMAASDDDDSGAVLQYSLGAFILTLMAALLLK